MENNREEIVSDVNGAIFDENPNDFMAGGENINIPANTNTSSFQYNQAKWRSDVDKYDNTRWSCALFSSLGAVSDLTGYNFSDTEILEIHRLGLDSYGLRINKGMYMSRGIDCVRNWWNTKFPDKKLISYKLNIGDSNYQKAINLKHSVVVGYYTSIEYSLEQSTGIISSESFPKGGGHLVRNMDLRNLSHIRDNYFQYKKVNEYQNEKIIPLVKNGIYFPSAYLFLYDEDNQRQKELDKKIAEIKAIIGQNKAEGVKRIKIRDTLKKLGYNRKNILESMRAVYGMNFVDFSE